MPVAVGVSGGADSLLALCLLQEQGSEPVAVHAHFLDQDRAQEQMHERLAQICARVGVELVYLDMRSAFEEDVVQPFVREYAQGRTPNPCAWCNRRMKFGRFLHAVRALGFPRVATGHYARLHWDCESFPGLYRGVDETKDQSYFLAMVGREQLQAAVLPLGNWTKTRVLGELARRDLRPAAGDESQEICFIPHNDYRAFLQGRDTELPGPGMIVDSQGRSLGRHQGLYRYTLGQRRGLGIAFSEPLYVLDKDMQTNTLIVGPRRELAVTTCRVQEVNALVDPGAWPGTVWLQTNYRQTPALADVRIQDREMTFTWHRPRPPASPGQIAVAYTEQGRVLGGGVIHG